MSKLRRLLGLTALASFLSALTLASSPQLHERLHKVDPQHECAATLLAAGNYHHAPPPPALPATIPAPKPCDFLSRNSELCRIAISSSVLEHAPPALI